MIGVVGDEGTDGLADRLGGGTDPAVTGTAPRVVAAGPDVVVAAGEAAVVDLVRAGVDAPVLPMGSIEGLPSVTRSGVEAAAERLLAGDYGTVDRRVLAATADGEAVGAALFDAMLVRAEPGRISEFGVAAGGSRARFRADGVVVATPTGSHGYARAAGGPRLAADVDAVTVVPVAPFGLGAPTWVFDGHTVVEVSVERDEGAVSVLLDGREERRLQGGSTVTLEPGGHVRFATLPDA